MTIQVALSIPCSGQQTVREEQFDDGIAEYQLHYSAAAAGEMKDFSSSGNGVSMCIYRLAVSTCNLQTNVCCQQVCVESIYVLALRAS